MTAEVAERPGTGPWRAGPVPGFTPFPASAVEGSVGARFAEVAAARPTDVALRSPAGQWTYAELDAAARGVAAALIAELGSEEARPVGILATHDGPLVVAILGVVLAGHIVVVLDPLAPEDQTAAVLAECDPPIVLHDAAHAAAAAALGDGRVLLDAGGIPPAEEPMALPERGPDDALMLAFTSGTSGSSKGGTITHGVLMNLVRGATDALGIGPEDRMPMLFPTSLAVAAYPMFLPLLNGGTLATLDVRSVGLAPVADFLADERITLAYMAPTVVRFLVDAIADRTFPDLRMIALGGELVDAEVVRLTAELFGPRHIANGFGTTETGVISLYVVDADAEVDGTVPAGYPVPEVDLLVLDDAGRPVDAGVAGEVAVATPHLFAGYWGHPELSATVLGPDPSGRPGWGLYRTGDLGRLDEHGALTVLGRLDTKVKVRGRFVVLGDVEADLHERDEVGDAVVVPVVTDGITELVGVLAPAPETALDLPALRAALLERREAYRVPSRWAVLDELPRLPNGKLDRRAAASVAERSHEAPASPPSIEPSPDAPTPATTVPADPETFRQVRAIWELLLPVGAVGPDDDFAHLGGDSLLAAQMLVMVEDRLGVTVPMGRLVHARTLRQVADVVAELAADDDPDPSVVACVQEGDPTARPRLWFLPDLPGSAYRVRHLAAALGADQPVWSVESPLLRGIANPYTGLDTFVARLLRDIRAAQPDGPYWLAGYSFGGICAYEMAHQLRRDGAEVAFLGVIDVGPGYRGPNWTDQHSPPWPYFGVPHPPAEDASPADAARHYREMVRRSPLGAARHLTLRTGVARHIDRHRFQADIRRTGRVRPERRLWYAWEEHWRLAVHAWDRATPYDGRLDLFWAAETGSTDATMGWGGLVADLHIHRMPGFHDHLLEHHGAPDLGAAVRPVLDDRVG